MTLRGLVFSSLYKLRVPYLCEKSCRIVASSEFTLDENVEIIGRL